MFSAIPYPPFTIHMDGIWMAKVGVARGNDRPREGQGVLEGVSHFSLPLRCRKRMLSHGVAPLLQQHACNTATRKREWCRARGGEERPGFGADHIPGSRGLPRKGSAQGAARPNRECGCPGAYGMFRQRRFPPH